LTPKELSGFSSIDDNPLGVCVSGPVFQNLNPDQMSQNIAAKAAEASERLFNTLLEKTKKEGRVSSLLEAEKAAVNLGKPFDELEETWLAVRALQGKHQNILDNPIYQKYLRDSKIPAEVIQKWIGKDKFDFEDSMTLAKKTGGYFFIQRAEALAPKLGLSFSELESGWLTVKSNQERIAAKAKRGNKNYVEVLKNSSIPEEKKTQWIRDYEASYAYKKPQPRPVQGPQPRPQEDVQGLEIDAQAAINKMMNSQFLNRAPQ
jgi:hypothetical protein